MKLCSQALIENLQDDIKKILENLDDMYMAVRYPEDYEYTANQLSSDKTGIIVSKVKETHKWLKKKIR